MTEESDRLRRLAGEFVIAKGTADKAIATAERFKTELREAAAALDEKSLPEGVTFEGDMFTFETVDRGKDVTVTRSDPEPPPPLMAPRFLARVGAEQFFRFVRASDLTIPSKAFDSGEWLAALAAEQVTGNALRESLGAAPKPRAWSVSTS